MTLEQLKSQAYDLLAGIQNLQGRLQEVNNAIANFKPEAPAEEVKPEEVK